jgi:hypothetical protein
MAAEVVNIFNPILNKVRKELKSGPLPVSYLCSKFGVAVFLQLLELTEDMEVTVLDHEEAIRLVEKEAT